MTYQLLPCPFCGGVAEMDDDFHQITDTAYHDIGISCTGCGVEQRGAWFKYTYPTHPPEDRQLEEEARRETASRWNRRT